MTSVKISPAYRFILTWVKSTNKSLHSSKNFDPTREVKNVQGFM